MKLIERTCTTAAQNIALDEALLLLAEREPGHRGFLRIWESPEPIVVVGRGSAVSSEVQLSRCVEDNVPVLRRSSGGAAVVASPGCLMYAVVLGYQQHPHLRSIGQAHRFVLEAIASSLAEILPGIQHEGISDLAMRGRKVSGNSLRCRQNWLLYHGTLLYEMQLDLIERYLFVPPRQPEYRACRRHLDFVANMNISRSVLSDNLVSAWQPSSTLTDWPEELTAQLVTEKYALEEWTMKIS